MRGGTGTRRRNSTGGGTGGGTAIFGGGSAGGGAGFAAAAHWLTRLVVSPIFSSAIFKPPLNAAPARETSSPTSAPMAGMASGGGAGTEGRSSAS